MAKIEDYGGEGIPPVKKPERVQNPGPKIPHDAKPHSKRKRLPKPGVAAPQDIVEISPEALRRLRESEGK
jgi:hypothetical protein